LPAPPDLWSLEGVEPARLSKATREVVEFQRDCGVDIVNEGELTKGGSWVVFVNERLTGFEPSATGASLEFLRNSEDWHQFGEFYQAAVEGGTLFEQTRAAPQQINRRLDWACTSPVKYVGQAALQRERPTTFGSRC
jgi:5-methyltetrahydropteroyltriglutamate--homocysteine methyltransferase